MFTEIHRIGCRYHRHQRTHMLPSEIRAQRKYNKKRPVVAFRLEISEREQMEMIQQAKETLNEAVRRVFRVGLETMKGEK